MNTGIKQNVEGFYKLYIVGEDGNVVWEQPDYRKNLILNVGMDGIADRSFANSFLYAIAGTGTRVNSMDSLGSKIVQSGTTIYLYPAGGGGGINSFLESAGGYLNRLSEGDIIKYSVGSGSITEVKVTGNILSGSATVNASATITASGDLFTIWKTSQTQLDSETKRAGTGISDSYYFTETGYCGSTLNGNVYELKRTYDFSKEAGSVIYSEVGTSWSQTAAGGSNTFSRILLPSFVTLAAGQRLRLTYQLNVSLYPSASYYRTANIDGWGQFLDSTESIQKPLIQLVNTDGTSTSFPGALDACGVNASEGNTLWISNVGGISAFDSATDRTGGSYYTTVMNKLTYTAGSYTVTKQGTFASSQMNRTDIKSFGLGTLPNTTQQAYALVLNNTQSKMNTQTLTLNFSYTWGRTLA